MDQLAKEAASRPADTVKLEQIVEALGKEGLALGQFQQSLGRTHMAAYCGNVRSADLYLLICEYPTSEALAQGRLITQKIFEQVPRHTFHVVKNTVVMLQRTSGEGDKQAEKVVAVLSKL